MLPRSFEPSLRPGRDTARFRGNARGEPAPLQPETDNRDSPNPLTTQLDESHE